MSVGKSPWTVALEGRLGSLPCRSRSAPTPPAVRSPPPCRETSGQPNRSTNNSHGKTIASLDVWNSMATTGSSRTAPDAPKRSIKKLMCSVQSSVFWILNTCLRSVWIYYGKFGTLWTSPANLARVFVGRSKSRELWSLSEADFWSLLLIKKFQLQSLDLPCDNFVSKAQGVSQILIT